MISEKFQNVMLSHNNESGLYHISVLMVLYIEVEIKFYACFHKNTAERSILV